VPLWIDMQVAKCTTPKIRDHDSAVQLPTTTNEHQPEPIGLPGLLIKSNKP